MELKPTVYEDVIEEVNIFLFNMPVEYSLGHCVAQDMRMSAGIAVLFKSTFGEVGQLMDQRPNVGDVAYLQQNDRYIYYLVSKDLSNKKPSYNTLTAAITKLRDFIVEHDVKKLAIPRIGCGLDKLNWLRVKNIIRRLFQGVGCMIKVCHFTHDKGEEKESVQIPHPMVLRSFQNVNDIKKREFEKLNFILYSRKNTLPVYWNQSFQLVNEKHCFKSQYYEDFEKGLEVGQCLHYETTEAHIYVITTNESTEDHFSYRNLEKGLLKICRMVENNQWHATFVIQKIYDPILENFINFKIVSLISSTFLNLVPCVILEV